MYVISNTVHDDCSLPLFQELVGDREGYYIWSCPPIAMDRFLQSTTCHSPVIFLGIKDQLSAWKDFDWWHDQQQDGTCSIQGFARRHPNSTIVLFTSVENLQLELNEPNLHIIPWGGDWVNQKTEYSRMEPVLDKNFNSDRTYISLNRNVRSHRLVTLSYLFGKKYDHTGVITYLKNHSMPDSFLDTVSWEFGPGHDQLRDTILDGFESIKSNPALSVDDYDVYQQYGTAAIDNAGNFENRLRGLYRNSFVEIVSESVFTTPSFIVTEKTANSFFGCNFPIILGGCGIVAHLRELGLDVFDDVVDHGYDHIENPFDRIVTAIESNRRLLLDTDHARQSWLQCRPRFEHNVSVMQNIYAWYETRAKAKFAQVMTQISMQGV
jgi:hypothetical protein